MSKLKKAIIIAFYASLLIGVLFSYHTGKTNELIIWAMLFGVESVYMMTKNKGEK